MEDRGSQSSGCAICVLAAEPQTDYAALCVYALLQPLLLPERTRAIALESLGPDQSLHRNNRSQGSLKSKQAAAPFVKQLHPLGSVPLSTSVEASWPPLLSPPRSLWALSFPLLMHKGTSWLRLAVQPSPAHTSIEKKSSKTPFLQGFASPLWKQGLIPPPSWGSQAGAQRALPVRWVREQAGCPPAHLACPSAASHVDCC